MPIVFVVFYGEMTHIDSRDEATVRMFRTTRNKCASFYRIMIVRMKQRCGMAQIY